MCGRYSLAADLEDIQQRFELFAGDLTYSPRYNIAPTQPVLAVTNDEGRYLVYLRWEFIPSWAKSASVGNRLINARAETVTERPSFRTALARRRCLVIADGFYEWQRAGNARRPMRTAMKSGEPFAFAGLWDSWRDPVGDIVRSCTIITTEPNELLRPIHNRMPVILPKELESFWLDDEVQDPFALGDILSPSPAEAMQAYEVSSLVNRPSNEGPEVAIPGEQESPSSVTYQAQLVTFPRGSEGTLT
jgi:putative SOS response-associated peptidase YedK